MDKPKILLVEDDTNLGQILKEYLDVKGYDTTLARDGEAGLKAFPRDEYAICILDVMMPKVDGFTLATEIRKMDTDIPIIFVTAKSMKEDTIQGFTVGGDDYITKPFSMEELLLRIKAILKRTFKSPEEDQSRFSIGEYMFDSDAQTLTHSGNGENHKLTSKESALLKLLCLRKNQMLDRSVALKKIWFDDNYFNSRSMDVYITKLRKYLKSDENIQIINVHGQGFKLVELKPEQ